MRVFGIDFTSRPKPSKCSKHIVCLNCTLDGHVLRVGEFEECTEEDFSDFEEMLGRPGPWIAGIDFPFGQARKFIERQGWPSEWKAYVNHAASLGRRGFCHTLDTYRKKYQKGDKEHRRKTDSAAKSVSPQKLYGVPVGLMFLEGAPRLVRSNVTIPHLQVGDPERIVVEAYPGVLARNIIQRRSYKSDAKKNQTPERQAARFDILKGLREGAAEELYGLKLDVSDERSNEFCEDPSGDRLDALLCAVQAAWAWQNRSRGFGAPSNVDNREGWIADPSLLRGVEAKPSGESEK
jgi:hypothetical protein